MNILIIIVIIIIIIIIGLFIVLFNYKSHLKSNIINYNFKKYNLIGGNNNSNNKTYELIDNKGYNSYCEINYEENKFIKYYCEKDSINTIYAVMNDNILKFNFYSEFEIYKYIMDKNKIMKLNIPILYADEYEENIKDSEKILDKIKLKIYSNKQINKIVMEYIKGTDLLTYLKNNGLIESDNEIKIHENNVSDDIMIFIYKNIIHVVYQFLKNGILPNDCYNGYNFIITENNKLYVIDYSQYLINDSINENYFNAVIYEWLVNSNTKNGKNMIYVLLAHKNWKFIIESAFDELQNNYKNDSDLNNFINNVYDILIYIFSNCDYILTKHKVINALLSITNKKTTSLINILKSIYNNNYEFKNIQESILLDYTFKNLNTIKSDLIKFEELIHIIYNKYKNDMPKIEYILSYIYEYKVNNLISDILNIIKNEGIEKELYVNENFPFVGYETNKNNKNMKKIKGKCFKLALFSNNNVYKSQYLNNNNFYHNSCLLITDVKKIETQYFIIPDDYIIDDCVLNYVGCLDKTHCSTREAINLYTSNKIKYYNVLNDAKTLIYEDYINKYKNNLIFLINQKNIDIEEEIKQLQKYKNKTIKTILYNPGIVKLDYEIMIKI